MREYSELRLLGLKGIDGRPKPEARSALLELAAEELEPSAELDRHLLASCQERNDIATLLCLRCRISHAVEAWLRGLHRQFGEDKQLELSALASHGLDDDGSPQLRIDKDTLVPYVHAQLASLPAGEIHPLSADVLRSYRTGSSGLPHWARLKIQGRSSLKAYLRQQGLLLISNWALLRHSSSKRVRESWLAFGEGAWSWQEVVAVHGRYQPLYDDTMAAYKARTGKASGWQPDSDFWQALVPEQPSATTEEQLLAMARAIRVLLSGTWHNGRKDHSEAQDEAGIETLADPRTLAVAEDPYTPAELNRLIQGALQRALDQHMRAIIYAAATNPEKQQAWNLYGQGLSQREIAECCKHEQGWVSKLLNERQNATAVATTAAVELKRHPAFSSCGTSIDAAERMVEVLQNHLKNPERKGTIAPLRQWVQRHLTQP